MSDLEGLFHKKVVWIRDENRKGWVFVENGNEFFLKLNDFPDEVMHTVSFGDKSINIDDLPKKWKIKY